MLLALSATLSPGVAFAAYENLSVTGTAQVKTDASLHVSEQRAFTFDERYSALEWYIPGADIGTSTNVTSVRALRANKEGKSTGRWQLLNEVPFNPSWRDLVSSTDGLTQAMEDYYASIQEDDSSSYISKPKNNTYSFDASNDNIYIFPKAVKSNTVYECSYNIVNAARVYDDVAEIYWTYSLPTGDMAARDIHMKIQLPVPEDAKVLPYENVYAWGHGPDGTVDIHKDGVIDIKVPLVKVGQYSLVHIVFPRQWLKNVDMKSESYQTGTRLGYALAEEDGWTDSMSAREVNSYTIEMAVCITCLIALLVSMLLYLIFGREKAPSNIDEDALKCEEAIRSEDPAVCGRLMRWNHHSAYDLAYVMQRLIEEKVMQITLSPEAGKIRFRLSPSSKGVTLDEVEQSALYLIFEKIGDGYQSISIDDVRDFCEKNPRLAYESMRDWQKVVSKQVDEADVFDRRSKRAAYAVLAISVVALLAGAASLALGFALWVFLLSIATTIACIAIAYNMPRRTQKGVNLAAKIEKCEPMQDQVRPIWEKPLADAFGDALTA